MPKSTVLNVLHLLCPHYRKLVGLLEKEGNEGMCPQKEMVGKGLFCKLQHFTNNLFLNIN